MRRVAVPAALSVLALSAGAAYAGAGLPRIASVPVGHYQANVYNSSPGARTGANTLTVEIPDLSGENTVALSFTGPGGARVSVPLKPLQVLGHTDQHEHESTSASHGAGHGSPAASTSRADGASAAGGHGGTALDTSAFLVRGKATLPAPGTWKGLLEITSPHGEKLSAPFTVTAERSGPNQIFVGSAGILMAGSIIYGVIGRRRGGKQHGVR